jgi:hypothetical protein
MASHIGSNAAHYGMDRRTAGFVAEVVGKAHGCLARQRGNGSRRLGSDGDADRTDFYIYRAKTNLNR